MLDFKIKFKKGDTLTWCWTIVIRRINLQNGTGIYITKAFIFVKVVIVRGRCAVRNILLGIILGFTSRI